MNACWFCKGEGVIVVEYSNGAEYRKGCSVCRGTGKEPCERCGNRGLHMMVCERVFPTHRKQDLPHGGACTCGGYLCPECGLSPYTLDRPGLGGFTRPEAEWLPIATEENSDDG